MGINVDLKPRKYFINLILGSLYSVFGFIFFLITAISKYPWRQFWFVYLFFYFFMIFGLYKLQQGASEWNHFEELEKQNMELENKKLELEIKILEKQLKKKH